MASKIVELPGIGAVTLLKSARSKAIRLSITPEGKVRVSLPHWTPYAVGARFAEKNRIWIVAELAKHTPPTEYIHGQKVGKLHRLTFERTADSVSSRVTATKVIIKISPNEQISSAGVQERTHKAVIRALKKEIEQLLRPRTKQYADKFGFIHESVSAKQLRRRWGSCDSQKNIVYNCFLMELPWDCIDYVILHELTHTEHMNHGEGFKRRLKQVCPCYADIKQQMKQYRPIIQN